MIVFLPHIRIKSLFIIRLLSTTTLLKLLFLLLLLRSLSPLTAVVVMNSLNAKLFPSRPQFNYFSL